MSISPVSRVLITGAAGFLGEALLSVFAGAGVRVRGFDVNPVAKLPSGDVEIFTGDVGDDEAVDLACQDCDVVVIAHMAPNRPGVYDRVPMPFDINVKGAALLLGKAALRGMRRVILVSSISVVEGHLGMGYKLTSDLPPWPTSLYGLTKTLQEESALYFHRKFGLPVTVLRPAYVTDADTLTDKYGNQKPSVNWQFVDRRDVAGAALAALGRAELKFGRYYVHGHPAASERLDSFSTERDLGWVPLHDFRHWPSDGVM